MLCFTETLLPFDSSQETTYLPVSAATSKSVTQNVDKIAQDTFASDPTPLDQDMANPDGNGYQLSIILDNPMDLDDTVKTKIVQYNPKRGKKGLHQLVYPDLRGYARNQIG